MIAYHISPCKGCRFIQVEEIRMVSEASLKIPKGYVLREILYFVEWLLQVLFFNKDKEGVFEVFSLNS